MIQLPFAPSSLSGHANGHWRTKARIVSEHRRWALLATLAANVKNIPPAGDIAVRFTIIPPDTRGDRTNYPNRLKPYIDGIADALKVNDRRFAPTYVFRDAEKPRSIIVEILPA